MVALKSVDAPTLVEILKEYEDWVRDDAVGEELAGALPKTIGAVVDAAREVEEELADMLAKMGGVRSGVHDRLRQAILALDRELTRGAMEATHV